MKLVISTAPPGEAPGLARKLVEEGLAACVNVIPGVRSVYRWDGEICDDGESVMLMKTTEEVAPALCSRLGELHSYDVPEAVVVEASGEGNPDYLSWVEKSVRLDGRKI